MNKWSRDSLSCLQNVHYGEFTRPILYRKEFVVKYPFKIPYWNSLDLVSIRTLKGILQISCQSRHISGNCFSNLSCAVGLVSYLALISE